MKQEVLSALNDLKTRSARSGLVDALVAGGILAPAEKDAALAGGSLGGKLRDVLDEKPEGAFQTPKNRAAYRSYVKHVEAQLNSCRRKDKVLLGLFVLGFLCTLAVIGWGLKSGITAKDAKVWASAVPTATVGVWNQYNARMIRDLMHDLQVLAKAEA
jgi:hypothetical protein